MAELTREWLQHLLHYDPMTGEWQWMNPRSSKLKRGDPAGTIQQKGYRYIKIDGVSYIAARLAFLYVTGEWPLNEVDHVNRVTWDDRWENLRQATRSENTRNRVKIGASGEPGIHRHSQNNRWVAQYDNIYIGSFGSIEEAKVARLEFIKRFEGQLTVSDIERNKS